MKHDWPQKEAGIKNKLKKMTIEQYQTSFDRITKCRFCGNSFKDHKIKGLDYDHSNGYKVDGFINKKWLYITCSKCGYDWSLKKLGFLDGGYI